MNPDVWRQLYESDFWANRQLCQCTDQLSDEQLANGLDNETPV